MAGQADAHILGWLLATQNVLQALPAGKRQAEFVAAALRDVPGVAQAGVCFCGSDLPACDGMHDPCPAVGTGCSEENPAGCRGGLTVVRLETRQAYYGRVVLDIGNPEVFAPYESFVYNYAAALALLLENRQQQSDLEQALVEHTRLEKELREQREELLVQNNRLEAARAEAARLFEKQRFMFVRLQEALLDVPQQMPGVKFGHVYRSATEEAGIGGDFYDVFEAKDGGVGILIGDVCGHGLDAARLATLVKDTVHAFAHQFSAPHHVLRETNRLLLEKKIAGFVTAFFGLLDPDTGVLVYSSAGHPPPLFADDGNVSLLQGQSTPLGVFFDARYTDGAIAMDPGQTVILYTDGVTEARRGNEFFGDDGLIEAVRALIAWPTEKLPSLLLERALAFSGGYLHDDVALLAVSYAGRPADLPDTGRAGTNVM